MWDWGKQKCFCYRTYITCSLSEPDAKVRPLEHLLCSASRNTLTDHLPTKILLHWRKEQVGHCTIKIWPTHHTGQHYAIVSWLCSPLAWLVMQMCGDVCGDVCVSCVSYKEVFCFQCKITCMAFKITKKSSKKFILRVNKCKAAI